MRWAERHTLLALALPCLLGATVAGADEKTAYGKVDTFEPGKKYSCVPTADHKGWDCAQTGKAKDQPPPEPAPPTIAPSTPPPAAERPPASVAAPPPPSGPAASAPQAEHAGELPGYLSVHSAGGGPPSQTAAVPPPTAPVQNAAVSTNPPAPAATAAATETQRAGAAAPHEPATATAAPAATPDVAAAPSASRTDDAPAAQRPQATQTAPASADTSTPTAASPPPAAPSAVPAATTPPRATAVPRSASAARDGEAFLTLDADQYVIELGHAASAAELDALDVHPPRGEVYKLHLLQNGADNWLLVWGAFDDVSAARAARAEFAATTAVTPGWPRRVAPLQAEVRRTRD